MSRESPQIIYNMCANRVGMYVINFSSDDIWRTGCGIFIILVSIDAAFPNLIGLPTIFRII